MSTTCVVTGWRQHKEHDYHELSTRAQKYDKLSTCLMTESMAFSAPTGGHSLLNWDIWARRSLSLSIEYDDLLDVSSESLPLLSLKYSPGSS